MAIDTVSARELFREIAAAAWECADPGVQFDTTINRWHTAPNTGRITASNPCSEYVHLENSACNLASINLLKFLREDGQFDVAGFRQAVEVVFTAQEILVGNADYPTEKIGETTRRFRELGLGYANLGAMLMALGLPYDSDGARAVSAAVTALMTGHAYATSAHGGNAAVMRALAHPALASGLAQRDVLVIAVAHDADGRHAVRRYAPDFGRRQFQQSHAAFARNQLRLRAGRTRHLRALAGP